MDQPSDSELESAVTPQIRPPPKDDLPEVPPELKASNVSGPTGRRSIPPQSAATPSDLHFQAGGVVGPESFYVRRRADDELPEILLRGEYAQVLGPRHSGKSSLRARTQARLESQGVRCASLNLGEIGSQLSEEQWYLVLVELLARRLGLPDPTEAWRNDKLPPVLRFQQYLRSPVLASIHSRVVLFIDDLEATLALPFPRADLFAALRACYNRRADEPEFQRLSLCLLGAATLLELGSDPLRTPFNIGQALTLADFTHEEASALMPGLRILRGNEQIWIDEVLDWTSGHPALTQRLCQALREQPDLKRVPDEAAPDIDEKVQVEAVVATLFLSGDQGDPVLLDIERRFRKGEPRAHVMLGLYRRLLEQKSLPIIPDNETQLTLRMAGLLAEKRDRDGPALKVRNRIFAAVFDEHWVKRHEEQRFLTARLATWRERDHHPYFVLQGEELAEALRWARDRDDVTPEEREFLLTSEEAALATERRKQEEEQVQQALQLSRERQRQRRRLTILLGLSLGVLLVLVGTIFWLSFSAKRARADRKRAEDDRARALLQLANTRSALEQEKDHHRRTRTAMADAQAQVNTMEQERERVKHDLGLKEAVLGEVTGKMEKLFKKRLPGSTASTGVSKDVVDKLMLKHAWPAIRACYPVSGPVPTELLVGLHVVPSGQIAEADSDAPQEHRPCINDALRSLRFPSYGGASLVRLDYRFRRGERKR